MYFHTAPGNTRFAQTRRLFTLIKTGHITLGGHYKAKIYGRLNCTSGKRMNIAHRVFFVDLDEAQTAGCRPCGHCLPVQYKAWKSGLNA